MGKYFFEYSDKRTLIKVFFISLSLFILFLFVGFFFFTRGNTHIIFFVCSIILPFVFFNFAKKMASNVGHAAIDEDRVLVELSDKSISFYISDISSYKIQFYAGVHLALQFNDNSKLMISASDVVCESSSSFKLFCEDLDKAIQSNGELMAKKKKTYMEKRAFLILLILLSVGLVLLFIISILIDMDLNGVWFISLLGLLPFWTSYIMHNKD